MFSIDLGVTVSDRITGFRGVVTGRCDYITGCNQYLVAPQQLKDANVIDARWFDEQRLVVDENQARVALDNSRVTGPDAPAPVK